MKRTTQILSEDFESLLKWFSHDAEEAGIEYEKIRGGLVRFFRFRGCSDPDILTDETINRVTAKVMGLDFSENNKKITIFYGFAKNVYREYIRSKSSNEVQLLPELPFAAVKLEIGTVDKDASFECLENCLKKLKRQERVLILHYFSKEKAEKILLRRKIAEELGITSNALHVRVYRLKEGLKTCIKSCKGEKDV